VSTSIHESVWIAPSAQLFGEISIGEGSSLWHNAVARAECQEIRIGRVTNLQDFVMVHVGYDTPTLIGDFCTVAHHATLHGCTVGDACLIGVGAVLMDGCVIGEGSIVAGGAVVPERKTFPPGSILAGVPARSIGERDNLRANRMNAWLYHRNAQAYRRGEHRAWDGPEFEAWREAKLAEVEADRDLQDLRGGFSESPRAR
jgi:carbonic anhydrase/acetyltransferase-like protein (isoleucine patch superfamily)